MNAGAFYFLNDQYFIDFNDPNLLPNKDIIAGIAHGRPCYYSFEDTTTGLYWMIPISSKVSKYRVHYDKKIKRIGICDTIVFGYVLGYEKAFLIQNMCPVNQNYIDKEYVNNGPVRLDGVLEKELIEKAKKVLLLQRKGYSLIFPDVLTIESKLLCE